MHREVERGCHLRPVQPLAQLQELASRLGLVLGDPQRAARCLVCNAVPVEVDKHAVEAALPPRTRASFERFWRCPGCARVYWHGSHWRRMHEALRACAQALEPSAADDRRRA